jgi:hypothetical protein
MKLFKIRATKSLSGKLNEYEVYSLHRKSAKKVFLELYPDLIVVNVVSQDELPRFAIIKDDDNQRYILFEEIRRCTLYTWDFMEFFEGLVLEDEIKAIFED